MSIYPPKIKKRFDSPQNAGKAVAENAVGTGASFTCGSFVRFSLRVQSARFSVSKQAEACTLNAKFQTNGCGYMIAAADVLADVVAGKQLTDLHGLDKESLLAKIVDELGEFPADRIHCREVCIAALRAAFADYRAYLIEEFRGEKALICTCFGVSEETIESLIMSEPTALAGGFFGLSITTVDDITQICNAGGGCGSCRMLIQEMLDR